MEKYEVKGKVGDGAQANVHKAVRLADGKVVAIKVFKTNTAGHIIDTEHEISRHLMGFSIDNVVHIEDVFKNILVSA
jgi:serine/threonine protein kinase